MMITLALLGAALVVALCSRRLRRACGQIRLLRSSMKREFHALESDQMKLIFPEKHAQKATLES